ncbi:hypothetical protein L7F22_004115 [Adiantum nelumboides]|nr:hypothetical protein [Adiantum nelumboides]
MEKKDWVCGEGRARAPLRCQLQIEREERGMGMNAGCLHKSQEKEKMGVGRKHAKRVGGAMAPDQARGVGERAKGGGLHDRISGKLTRHKVTKGRTEGGQGLHGQKHKGERAVGYASLWGAVFADVGTCLLVIINSMLLLERKKDESGCMRLFAFRQKCRSKVCQKDVLLSSEKYVDLEAEPWCPKKMEDNRAFAHDEGLLVSSDATDVGSEVRDSLLGGSSEGDVESVRYQELASYVSAHGTVRSQEFSSKEVGSAPICHLDKHEDERDMILQYYNEEWGHSKEFDQMDVNGRSNLDLGPLAHLGVWDLKFASVQSYKHFIADFQNCPFNNTYLLEATEENKIKVLGKDFGGWAKLEEADDSV